MNCIKFRSELPSKTHFQNIFWQSLFPFFSSCGGGTVPEYLSEAKVDVSIWTPKGSSLQKEGLNLVKAIVPLKDLNS
jgi:hypothetical protein